MLGLFGTLNLGTRALQAQRTGVEVAGQNLANVNNPAYARQRVEFQTSYGLPTTVGTQGSGVQVVAIRQLRDALVDGQIVSEQSVGGYWDAQQRALQYAQAGLGEYLSSSATSATSSATTGLADEISGLFNAFQSVATAPTSMAERQTLINQAQSLATRFNESAQRLDDLRVSLNTSLGNDVATANNLLADIASLNDQVARAELTTGGVANDLRDLRQQKLGELAELVNIETGSNPNGTLTVSLGGVTMVSDRNVLDTLETYDAGGGQMLIRAATAGTPLTLTGGSIQGTIDVRDGALRSLRSDLDTLASSLITAVNAVHRPGYSLTGSFGADFFTGTDAASLSVNAALKDDPSLIQAAGVSGALGDNTVALALARLADQPNPSLGNQPFGLAYGQIVANLGHGLANANAQLASHGAVKTLLSQQRDAVSGVSLDEEMADLVRYQRAYEASARIISTVSEMLDTVVNLGR